MCVTYLLFFVLILTMLSLQPTQVTGQTLNTIKPGSHHRFINNDIISTRGRFDLQATGELILEHNTTNYLLYNDDDNTAISKIQYGLICPPQKEIIIYVHREWTAETSAKEQINRTEMSLTTNNYTVPSIGFSWDLDTSLNKDGWETAKKIVENNGQKLSQFILDFKRPSSI